TKPIQWKYHFVQDNLVGKGKAIEKMQCPFLVLGDDMVADILTKPLIQEQHWKFVWGMGL
ncbi:hypothetical protein PAXRUDRAFT_161122, partial [Paxillus rubicundulus Ve08.2h10]